VGLYVGYYQSQRTGEPSIRQKTASLAPAGSRCRWSFDDPMAAAPAIVVNGIWWRRGLRSIFGSLLVSITRRVIASEYSGKAWLVFDAITRNRTDGL